MKTKKGEEMSRGKALTPEIAIDIPKSLDGFSFVNKWFATIFEGCFPKFKNTFQNFTNIQNT